MLDRKLTPSEALDFAVVGAVLIGVLSALGVIFVLWTINEQHATERTKIKAAERARIEMNCANWCAKDTKGD
jgi:predicted ferric reductase